MNRKLARVEKIQAIEPIDGADAIETVKIGGWKVVVRKDENFAVNDHVMYFEVDSYLPIEERYEFLRKYSYKKLEFKDGNPDNLRDEGFRIKTVKLRGIYSQGLVMPIGEFKDEITSSFPYGEDTDCWWVDVPVGTDFTDILDVKVFTKPIPMEQFGIVKGDLPFSIPSTDQERIQNLPEFFDDYKDLEFEESEKVDGFSMTVYYNNGEFGVCKRNWDLIENDESILWRVARRLDLEKHLKDLGKNVAIQGELVGESINKNPLRIVGQKYFVFDIWDIDNRRYLITGERMEIMNFLKETCNIEHVPIVNNNIFIFKEYPIEKMDDLVKRANGKSLVTKGCSREGLVFKSSTLVNGQTVSFKVLDNKYIIKQEAE